MSLQADYTRILARIEAATRLSELPVRLLAVSKTQSAQAVRDLAAQGQRAFGENYVQEGSAKIDRLRDLGLEWHLIGPLQSNKCAVVARDFDWLQSLDREKLIAPLARHRPLEREPLQVLVQVNIDAAAGKSGATPDAALRLCDRVAAEPRLRLRGLMSIPTPHQDLELRRPGFRALRELFERARQAHPTIDTVSVGMSEDFELAIAQGATMVRIGTALFGARGSAATPVPG